MYGDSRMTAILQYSYGGRFMKKRFTLIAVFAALLALTVVGCKTQEDVSSLIIGTWEGTGGSAWKYYTYEFSSSGTGKRYLTGTSRMVDSFDWSVNGTTLTINGIVDYEVEISGDTMTWTVKEKIVGKFERK